MALSSPATRRGGAALRCEHDRLGLRLRAGRRACSSGFCRRAPCSRSRCAPGGGALSLLPLTPAASARGPPPALAAPCSCSRPPSRSARPAGRALLHESTKPFPALTKDRILDAASNSLSDARSLRAGELTGLWGLSDGVYARDHPDGGIPSGSASASMVGAHLRLSLAEGKVAPEPVFDYLPSTIGYAMARPESALVIGSGGGIDVIAAFRKGAREVTAVEINAIIMDVSREFAGLTAALQRRGCQDRWSPRGAASSPRRARRLGPDSALGRRHPGRQPGWRVHPGRELPVHARGLQVVTSST